MAGVGPAGRQLERWVCMPHPLPNSGGRTAAIAAVCASLMLLAAGIRDRAAAAPEAYRTVPAGTSIVGSLQSTISTGKNHVGDPVRLRLLHSVRLSGNLSFPRTPPSTGKSPT